MITISRWISALCAASILFTAAAAQVRPGKDGARDAKDGKDAKALAAGKDAGCCDEDPNVLKVEASWRITESVKWVGDALKWTGWETLRNQLTWGRAAQKTWAEDNAELIGRARAATGAEKARLIAEVRRMWKEHCAEAGDCGPANCKGDGNAAQAECEDKRQESEHKQAGVGGGATGRKPRQ